MENMTQEQILIIYVTTKERGKELTPIQGTDIAGS